MRGVQDGTRKKAFYWLLEFGEPRAGLFQTSNDQNQLLLYVENEQREDSGT